MIVKNTVKTSVSSVPTSAFPIDARTYFESYDDAVDAASTAQQQGSTNAIYYYGMTVVVYENNELCQYVIVRDTSKDVGGILKPLFTEGNLILEGGTAADADPENSSEMEYTQ